MSSDDIIRPRLVLVTTHLSDEGGVAALRAALSGGDVASVIIEAAGRGADAFQAFAEVLVPLIQDAGAAAIIADDSQCVGRVKADGLHLSDGNVEALAEAIERLSPKRIVGGSGFKTRHDALEAGERYPDYILFGQLNGDTHDAAHRKNLDMAEWWAKIVEIPCIVLAGRDIESVADASRTGAEFVAASYCIFGEGRDPAASVARANDLLAETYAEALERSA